MAVLLEGINIPEGNPITINIYRDGTWVNAYTTEDGNAIEVPEPHGRLGDLDALYSHIKDEQRKCNYPCDGWSECQVALGFVNSAPTVISASEEG